MTLLAVGEGEKACQKPWPAVCRETAAARGERGRASRRRKVGPVSGRLVLPAQAPRAHSGGGLLRGALL